ncbi:MAG: hypothetical protein ACE364_04285 [Chlorobiota bacterium]
MYRFNILTLFIAVLLLFSCSSINKDDLLAEFNNYQYTIVNGEYRTTVNHVVPEVFQYISEDDYVFNKIRKLEETKDYTLRLGSFSNVNIIEMEKIEGIQYAIIQFSQERIRDYKDNDEIDSENQQYRRNSEKEIFGIAFGVDNVEYDSENDRFIFNIVNNVLAKFVKTSQNWKFVNVADAGMINLNNIFPEELLEKVPEDENYKRLKENKNWKK